jgi:hypothetical protein
VGRARRTWLDELYRQHNTQFEIRNGDINAGAPGGSNGFGLISGVARSAHWTGCGQDQVLSKLESTKERK